ncbi:calpain-like cysteine peptidase, Clan CA, family C2 [Trypanosoma conorhini]|uniref:Calpain-like cysteine peptidase, Clan CA, family C2 n=1 Tax=Trypanosoma conorhini TaxID=83891 RepID=A0A3R7MSW1_9TRYP|nr:calpain-like cysteine peptidase, Clan CA, family C2 [Trypanosoma conorhini]RNF20125.1 calpain-like cysteine peptidase, Clan CA, family C2 [Trypanosoma conorhini]
MGSPYSKYGSHGLLANPEMHGDLETWLFNGLLLRVIDTSTGTWAFFNNSKDYEFHITYLLNADSMVEPLNKTTIEVQDDGILCEMMVYPLETQRFIVGEVTGYESKIEALPLSDDYLQSHPNIDERAYCRRLVPPSASQF